MAPFIAQITWIEALFASAVIAILLLVVVGASARRDFARECQERGGSWMAREQVCLRPEFAIPLGAK